MFSRIAISIVIGILILAGCANEPIKIGFMADLTGRASETGISARNGAEMAVDEINRAGGIKGRKVQLIIKDDKGIPEEAVKVDKDLINEKVVLGIGHMTSGTGIPGLEIYTQGKTLMISPLMSTERLREKSDYFIRVIDSNKKQADVLADAALSIKTISRMALVYEYNNRAYSEEICKYFRERYEKSGGIIVFEDYFSSSPNTNLEQLARTIVVSGANGVLIVSGGLDLGILIQKIKKDRPEMEVFSGMWGMTEDAIEKGGKAINGAYFAGIYDKNDKTPDFVRFRSAYIDRYRVEPNYAALYTYETVRMVGETLQSVSKISTENIKKQICSNRIFNGLQGNFTIDENGDTERGYYLFKVLDAGFVRVK